MNDAVTASMLRSKLKAFMDKVCAERVPLLVTRKNGEDVVIISREEYEALDETAYLSSSPENARRLKKAITDVEGGIYQARDLVEG